jgi:hypothetical protein
MPVGLFITPNFEQIANILFRTVRDSISQSPVPISSCGLSCRGSICSQVSNTHLACPVIQWAVELVCNQLIASPAFLLIAKQHVPVQMYPAYQQAV